MNYFIVGYMVVVTLGVVACCFAAYGAYKSLKDAGFYDKKKKR